MAGRLGGTARQGFGCHVKLGKGSFKWMDQEGWISWFQCATLQIMICQSYPESPRSTRFAPRCSLPRLPMRWQTLWLHWNGLGLGSDSAANSEKWNIKKGHLNYTSSAPALYIQDYEIKYGTFHSISIQFKETTQKRLKACADLVSSWSPRGAVPVFPFWALLRGVLSACLGFSKEIAFFFPKIILYERCIWVLINYRIIIWESKGAPPNPTPQGLYWWIINHHEWWFPWNYGTSPCVCLKKSSRILKVWYLVPAILNPCFIKHRPREKLHYYNRPDGTWKI